MMALRVRRRWRAASAPLLAVAVIAVGVAVLLAVSPLNEMPDTYCQSALRPPGHGVCSHVVARRWHWIVVVLVVAAVLGVVGLLLRRGGPRHSTPSGRALLWVLGVAVVVELGAAAYLTVGMNHELCGSTLSRVDESGVYDSQRPATCAAAYADSRQAAWILGLLGGALLVGASTATIRSAA